MTDIVKSPSLDKLRRPISVENPMFMLMVYENVDYPLEDVWAGVPDDLKPYVVIHLNGPQQPELADYYERMLVRCDEIGVPAMTQIDHAWHEGRYFDNAWVERMFQEHPTFLGPIFCELVGRKYETVWPMLPIAARYGGYVLNNDYLNNEVALLQSHSKPEMTEAMRAFSGNYLFVTKQTTQSQYIETEAIACGLWMSDFCEHWGAGLDSWCWHETGRAAPFAGEPGPRAADPFKSIVTYPESQYSMMMYQSALAGATIFANFEHSSYAHGYQGKVTPCFTKEIVPTMRTIVEKKLIPTKEELRARTKVALVDNENAAVLRLSEGYYCHLNADSSNVGWLHTTGRYGVVPLILSSTNETERHRFPETMLLTELRCLSSKERVEWFNERYPAIAEGDACVHQRGSTWYVHNSHENRNEVQMAQFRPVELAAESVKVALAPNGYALLEESSAGLRCRLGNYCTNKDAIWAGTALGPDEGEGWNGDDFFRWVTEVYQVAPDKDNIRTSVITVRFPGTVDMPDVKVDAADGCFGLEHEAEWNARTGALRLQVSHNGAVEVLVGRVSCQGGTLA